MERYSPGPYSEPIRYVAKPVREDRSGLAMVAIGSLAVGIVVVLIAVAMFAVR